MPAHVHACLLAEELAEVVAAGKKQQLLITVIQAAPAATQAAPAAAAALTSSRPISIRRISLVPAPISYSFASRSNRPVG